MSSIRVYLFLICFKLCTGKIIDYNIFNSPVVFSNVLQGFLAQNTSRLSLNCKEQLGRYAQGLLSNELWALKIFDASGKPPSGTLSGNHYGLGIFDQCLHVEQTFADRLTIYGKYCLESSESLHETSRNYMLATCTPHECSSEEITEIFQNSDIRLNFSKDSCHSKLIQTEFDIGALITIIFFAIIFGVIILATIFDAILHCSDRSQITHKLYSSASILSNGKKLIKCGSNTNQIVCLYGIRVLTLGWVVAMHSFLLLRKIPIYSTLQTQKLTTNAVPSIGSVVIIDPFFLMTGITVTYTFMQRMKEGHKFHITFYYLHRFVRLTPTLASVVLIYSTLLKYFGSGPFWKNVEVTDCQNYWWATLLYIQNYVAPLHTCVPVSWYLSVDTQLYILSPLLLLALKKWPKISLSCSALLAVLSTAGAFLSMWINELNIFPSPAESDRFLAYYYASTHTRAAPWFLGIILGYFLSHIQVNKRPVRIPKLLVVTLWTVSLIVMYCCIHPVRDLLISNPNRLLHSLFGALSHLFWTLAFCWIIFACVAGYGGPVNWFLSLPFFEVLSKISYATYLIHDLIINVVGRQTRSVLEFSIIQAFCFICGTFILSLVAAVILTLTIELPFVGIENIIRYRKRI